MRLFMSNGTGAARQQALLALCTNGEWREPVVKIYKKLGSGLNMMTFSQAVPSKGATPSG